jgi:hypothetical protein
MPPHAWIAVCTVDAAALYASVAELPPEDSTNVPPVGVPLIVTVCVLSPARQYFPDTPLLYVGGVADQRGQVAAGDRRGVLALHERAAHGVDRQHRVDLQARVGGEAGEVVVLVHDLADAVDEVGVDATGRRCGGAERDAVRGLREVVAERAGAAGAESLPLIAAWSNARAIAVGRSCCICEYRPAGFVMATSFDTGTSSATFLPVITFTPMPACAAGFTPPSDTHPATGTSIGTGWRWRPTRTAGHAGRAT